MDTVLRKKYDNLIETLKIYSKVAVAFSGGVDSTFLAKVAFDTLGDNALAITVQSQAYPHETFTQTRDLAGLIGIGLLEISADVRDIPRFCDNPPDRCYHCKRALFSLMLEKAGEHDIDILVDGSIVDDDTDYRPGHRALNELEIKSPLKDNGFSKSDIRELSKELKLPTWNLQSFACLASRFPYGDRITPELLERVARAEAVLRELDILRYRVRDHGDIARIEVDNEGFDIISRKDVRDKVVESFKSLGYTYVSLDLEGYRTGSMNEPLGIKKK